MSATAKRLEFSDTGPDEQGRRHFTPFWLSDGAHGTLDPASGLHRRAQCFFTDPAPYVAQGFTPTKQKASRPMRKPTSKQIDARIEKAYDRSCNGCQIDIMKIGAVFAHGRTLVATGADDVALETGLRAYVDTIKGN